MFVFKISSVVLVMLLSLYQTALANEQDYQTPQGVRSVMRVYDECSKADGGFVPCLKKKAIAFMDRVSRIDAINIGEGVKVIRLEGVDVGRALSENELEISLPRGVDDRDITLTNLLIERVANFFKSRTVQIGFPKLTSGDLGRALEEGRGRMKKMMGMMMMGMAMKMVGLIPIAIAGLYLLAGKALIVSKIALLLAGIIGLKKLLSGRGGGGSSGGSSIGSYSAGGSSGGWSSGGGGGGGGGHGGGWDRRSIDTEQAAQNLAYRGYTSQ